MLNDRVGQNIAPYLFDVTVKYQEWLGNSMVYLIESGHRSILDKMQTMIVYNNDYRIYLMDSWVSNPVLKDGRILAFAGGPHRYYGRYDWKYTAKVQDFENSYEHISRIPIIFDRPVFEAGIRKEVSTKQEFAYWMLKKIFNHRVSLLENRVVWGNTITGYEHLEQFPRVSWNSDYNNIIEYYQNSNSA